MTVYTPDVAYRGTRTYVHSTDLYAEILAGCEQLDLGIPDGPMQLRFRRALTAQPAICFTITVDDGGADPAVEFFVTIAGQRVAGMVRATTRPVTRRASYDERPIWDRAILRGTVIALREECAAAPIEVLTALAVLQHRALCPPAPGNRWMLGRLELARPLRSIDAGALEVTLCRQIGGRMTRSTIASDGAALGQMDFILGEA